jgi:beta-fructofuranosidase
MLTHPKNHIGDSWYYVCNDTVHCFYLTCPDTIARHTAWDIGHAVSHDLVHWDIQDLILHKGEPGSYDGICPATGSVLRFQGRYWLAYTGNWHGPNPTVALAVSDDLYHWEKCPFNPVTRIDPRYYEKYGIPPIDFPHWRDPFLFEYEGMVYHYVCARSKDGKDDFRGTVGVAKTKNMHQWEILPPPDIDPVAMELEVPLLHTWGGRYYLMFSTLPELFSETFRVRYPEVQYKQSSYAMVGPGPFGPFRIHGNGQIIPPDYPIQPYANQVVWWKEHPFLLGTVWDDDAGGKTARQDYICNPIPLQFTETGIQACV